MAEVEGFSMIVRESKNLKILFRLLLDQDLRTSNLDCLNTWQMRKNVVEAEATRFAQRIFKVKRVRHRD